MRKLLTYAIPVILGVGVLAALVSNPSEKGQFSASQKGGLGEEVTGGLPAVIEEPTTSTTTTVVPAPETTTTTVAPTTTTVYRPVSPPKPAAPRTTPTTRPAPQPVTTSPPPTPVDCGTGSASAKATLVSVAPNRYRLVATVTSSSSKAIELDRLVIKATTSTVSKTFSANVAGRRVEPGASISVDIPESEGGDAWSPEITEFAFHTAGLPECSSQ